MSLTPLEIENVQFRKSMFGGYDRTDVERFLAQAARAIDDYVTRIDQLQRQLAQQEADLARYRENEEHLKHSVVLAQRTADELIAAARQRADSIKGEAALEADKLRHSLVDLRNEREQFEFAFHGLLSGFMRRLEANNPALVPRGEAGAPLALPVFPAVQEEAANLNMVRDGAPPLDASLPIASQKPKTADPAPTPAPATTQPGSALPVQEPDPLDADALDFARALDSV